MPLAGEQLTIKEALALCWVAGFRKEKLVTAVAVMCAESGRYVEAWHDNIGKEGQVASVDRGLFQINSVHEGSISATEAFDPVGNAGFAFQLSDEGRDWSPWMAYVSGAHEKFLEGVRVVKDEGNWQSRKKMWQ
jgi:hypothetical protein